MEGKTTNSLGLLSRTKTMFIRTKKMGCHRRKPNQGRERRKRVLMEEVQVNKAWTSDIKQLVKLED